ncbi:L,D-transpeptidase family protein [Elongatibacter sediminis]|uniref:L,D-transpeptidase family protein n=1 Tax=Elongatibacter sediminis TaxID=3119006 RepID=A0AAW9RMN9_9GAMM
MPGRRGIVQVLAVLAAIALGDARSDTSPDELKARLESMAADPSASPALTDLAAVRSFYGARAFVAAWQGPACLERLADLSDAIKASDAHGLNSDVYHRSALARSKGCSLDTELAATDAWLSLAAHLRGGRTDPVTLEPDWTARRLDMDFAARLEQALAEDNVRESLLGLAPSQPFYRALKEALVQFRGHAARGGWPAIDDGPVLRAGDAGPRVQQLRSRLARGGLLDPSLAESTDPFDATLEAAVKTFQLSANLEPDGIVGAMTLSDLNQTAADRVAQLRVNLERWRWLPEDLGQKHIRVNIADFRLEARAAGAVEREHKVIVGRQYRRTPIFSGEISYLVLNPWWETPRRLTVQDKLPTFRQDPGAVDRLGFEIVDAQGRKVDPGSIDWATVTAQTFPFRLRQAPGPLNALGQVKIMFPNSHAVYLHDTPTRGLFSRVRRDFSSGCIRVEDALGLTAWILNGSPGWDRARIEKAVASGKETRVEVPARVPVHLLYLTVVPGTGNHVRFIDDIYGRDTAVLEALDG